MRVLVLDEGPCVPADSGKRIRTFELLRRLANQFEITFAFHDEVGLRPEHRQALEAAGLHPLPVSRPPLQKQGPRFAWDLLRNIPMGDPYMVMAHRTQALRQVVAQAARGGSADLVHVEWTPLVENVPLGTPLPLCISAHNVESEIWDRYHETERRPLHRAYIGLQRQKVHRFERAALARADAVLAVSERDAERLRMLSPGNDVTVVENGVDIEYFAPDPAAEVDPHRLVFVGSLDWRPNQDAVVWFVDEILPRVRAQHPQVTFDVVGRAPSAGLRDRLNRVPGVAVHASVPDVRPFVRQAAATVVPLRIGGGSRLKICEALAMARPVVSTSVGAEGLSVGDGVVLADGAESFASAVVATLADVAGAAARTERGRRQVLLSHSWDQLAPRQAEAWLRAARLGAARRGA